MEWTKAVLGAVLFAGMGLMSAAVSSDTGGTSSSCATVMGSQVCTWVTVEEGSATELGATIPLSLVQSVSTDVEMIWPPRELATVRFPREARELLGIDHLGLNWEAHGHPPATFVTPHFDFHFYTISEDDVRAIDCSDESKPDELPSTYALPDVDVPGMGRFVGLCVPSMGMHAMPGDDVDETDPFSASMLVGYYGREPIFLEPMVSRQRLLERTDFSLPMPRVVAGRGARFPRAFRAEYDAHAEAYRLVFSDFGSE